MNDLAADELRAIARLAKGTSQVYSKLPQASPDAVAAIFAALAGRIDAVLDRHTIKVAA